MADEEALSQGEDTWDDEDMAPLEGFEAILTPFLGYEVRLETGRLTIIQPSTPKSDAILVAVYNDCLVIEGKDEYLVVPREGLITSIPREEWESE